MTKSTDDYNKYTVEEVLTDLGPDGGDKGLSEDEAKKRPAEYGFNELLRHPVLDCAPTKIAGTLFAAYS
jgi:hypothetical protein